MFVCPAVITMRFVLLINIKMPTIADTFTLKGPRKILEQKMIYFCFSFFRKNNA